MAAEAMHVAIIGGDIITGYFGMMHAALQSTDMSQSFKEELHLANLAVLQVKTRKMTRPYVIFAASRHGCAWIQYAKDGCPFNAVRIAYPAHMPKKVLLPGYAAH